jgi:hypothetical protein
MHEAQCLRIFMVAFFLGLMLISISSVLPFPFNMILFACGFSVKGFGYGAIAIAGTQEKTTK